MLDKWLIKQEHNPSKNHWYQCETKYLKEKA